MSDRRRHRHRRRHPRLLDRAASGAARAEADPGREGLCRPPRLGRQCRRRAPARARTSPRSRCRSPRWRCGSRSRSWSATIAASRATARCWWRRARQELDGFRARVDDLRLQGLHARGADRPRPSCGAWCRRCRTIARAAWSRAATARPIRSAPRRRSAAGPIERGAERDRGRDGDRPRARTAACGGSRPATARSRRPRS